ncbi:hypothetical protein A2U01_0091189, partial [Trifolium medium]|nr:hypothetical protein [Trifolium medium]
AQPEPMAQNENEALPEPSALDNEARFESEDSALDVRFGDSDDEVGLEDEVGLNDTSGVDNELDDDVQGGAG